MLFFEMVQNSQRLGMIHRWKRYLEAALFRIFIGEP